MNYIAEIKAFYDWLETNSLNDSAISLWHALMHVANKTGWQQEFTVAISTLEIKTGLNKKTIERARNKLQQMGRIDWKKRGGNQSAVYEMLSLCDTMTPQPVSQSVPQSVSQSVPQSVPQSVAINKLNETKLNKRKEVLPPPPFTEHSRVSFSQVQELFSRICVSYPQIRMLSESRKKAITARVRSGYTLEDFETLFQKAEASAFLKGASKRNWHATFDWLINDANMAKVLEGRYDNEEGEQHGANANGGDSSSAIPVRNTGADRPVLGYVLGSAAGGAVPEHE